MNKMWRRRSRQRPRAVSFIHLMRLDVVVEGLIFWLFVIVVVMVILALGVLFWAARAQPLKD